MGGESRAGAVGRGSGVPLQNCSGFSNAYSWPHSIPFSAPPARSLAGLRACSGGAELGIGCSSLTSVRGWFGTARAHTPRSGSSSALSVVVIALESCRWVHWCAGAACRLETSPSKSRPHSVRAHGSRSTTLAAFTQAQTDMIAFRGCSVNGVSSRAVVKIQGLVRFLAFTRTGKP